MQVYNGYGVWTNPGLLCKLCQQLPNVPSLRPEYLDQTRTVPIDAFVELLLEVLASNPVELHVHLKNTKKAESTIQYYISRLKRAEKNPT